MIRNPERAARGGDVEGTDKTDVTMGAPVDVAAASFDPGYSLDTVLSEGYVSEADLKQGYSSYGVGIGDGRPKGMFGGKR